MMLRRITDILSYEPCCEFFGVAMIVTRTVCVFLMSHTFVESFTFYIYQTYLDREIKEKQNAKEIEANRDKIL